MKTILYMAQTVNGYIAGERAETPWSKEEWKNFARFSKKHGNLIVGRTTYRLMKQHKEFSKIGNPFTVVVSHKTMLAKGKIVFAKSPKSALVQIKKMGFKIAIVAGGGKLNASFMAQKLVDEIYLDVEPIVFGKGINLFVGKLFEQKLKLLGTKKLSANSIQLHYKVRK